MRIIIAAFVGAIIVFVVNAVLRTQTPLGPAGLQPLPKEDAVIEALRANVPQPGLYIFPWSDHDNPTPEKEQAFTGKLSRGPSGLLAYTAGGAQAISPRKLGMQFVTVLLATFVAAWLVSRTVGSYGLRVIVAPLLPLFAFLTVSVSQTIWYGFTWPFGGAGVIIEIIAFLLAGLAMARIVPPPLR